MKRKATEKVLIFALILVFSACLAGCGDRISQKNFRKIENGMTEAEVGEILGEPTEAASMGLGKFSGSTSTWKGESGTISIQFMNGKVAMKTFTTSKE